MPKFKFDHKKPWEWAPKSEAHCLGMSCSCAFYEGETAKLYFKVQADIHNVATFYAPWIAWWDYQTKHEIYIRPPGETSRLAATFTSENIIANTEPARIGAVPFTFKSAGTAEILVVSYTRYQVWPLPWKPWDDKTATVWETDLTINPVSE
jgi:hypothetical protein